MFIRYTMRTKSTYVLGPGRRAALWVLGCPRKCEDCIAADMNAGHFFSETAQSLCDWFLDSGADGLTLSGGEPFFAYTGLLAQMIRLIREKKPETNVMIYTGYTHEELLAGTPEQKELLAAADVIIDGPYIREQNTGSRFGVGSDNQRVIRLTDRFSQAELDEYYAWDKERRIVLQPQLQGIQLIGVPDHRQLNMWKTIFKNNKEVVLYAA